LTDNVDSLIKRRSLFPVSIFFLNENLHFSFAHLPNHSFFPSFFPFHPFLSLSPENPDYTSLSSMIRVDPSQIKLISECIYEIPIGFVPNMRVPGRFYATPGMAALAFDELNQWLSNQNRGLPSIMQIAYVSTLPSITCFSFGMPDMHSGYGFSIGGVAAFDTADPNCVISPGGVGYDINCGVRCMTTGLTREQVQPHIKSLVDELYKVIPVGVGGKRSSFLNLTDIPEIVTKGACWAVERGYGVPADLENCEEGGCVPYCDPELISVKATARGKDQVGTLGAGNHYVEVQYVDEVFDTGAGEVMGVHPGDVVVTIHTGSRGFGYQVADEFILEMKQAGITTGLPDPQLAFAPLGSELGQRYLHAMGSAANFAWCNRQVIMHFARRAFQKVFPAAELKMDLIYDVAHNIAKIERHVVDGVEREFIVHRKGATRAFGPGREEIPLKYREIGQPVLIGGSMGTASYILAGNEEDAANSFGSTCHGAGRTMSRTRAEKGLSADAIRARLNEMGVELRAASKTTIVEEAPEAYKDVEEVVNACHIVGISRKVARLIPMGVIKG
jgi:tRNA-splicing ligase RtcB